MQAKEARKKAIDDMDPKVKEAFENIKFYKFYPVKTPDTPDVSNVKVCDIAAQVYLGTVDYAYSCLGFNSCIYCIAGKVHQQILQACTSSDVIASYLEMSIQLGELTPKF